MVSVSASRNLMNACRVTPIRLASRSIARSKSTGKSTFTRWTSRPGRVAFVKSRCALRSSPESCISSRRAALIALVCEVARFFVWTRTADRDDADLFIAVSDKCGPNVSANLPDHLTARFVEASSRNFYRLERAAASFRSAAASRRSTVSNPSVNQPYIAASLSSASSCLPSFRSNRAKLVTARSSNDLAF